MNKILCFLGYHEWFSLISSDYKYSHSLRSCRSCGIKQVSEFIDDEFQWINVS
jgi:hypothetical protein